MDSQVPSSSSMLNLLEDSLTTNLSVVVTYTQDTVVCTITGCNIDVIVR